MLRLRFALLALAFVPLAGCGTPSQEVGGDACPERAFAELRYSDLDGARIEETLRANGGTDMPQDEARSGSGGNGSSVRYVRLPAGWSDQGAETNVAIWDFAEPGEETRTLVDVTLAGDADPLAASRGDYEFRIVNGTAQRIESLLVSAYAAEPIERLAGVREEC